MFVAHFSQFCTIPYYDDSCFILSQFKFNLYVEVEKTPESLPLTEFKGDKRLWLKVDNLTDEQYQQHFKPTLFNTNMKILTTEQYIPPYLEGFVGEHFFS